MPRLPTTVPLAVVVAVAALVAIPASAGGDAHAEQAGPTMFVVQDGALNMFHPNGTFAFERDVWIPGNIGIGPNGRIVSLSYGDCHVTTYHPNGTADFCFGKLGRGPGQFDNAHSLAVGPDGRIAVTDSGNARVQVFHPNGTLVFAFGTRDDGQLPDPDGVDIGPDGRVYVVNAGRQPYNITVLHPNGTLDFSSALSERVRSNVVAVGPDGRIAMRYSHDVRIFHPNGTLDHVIGSRGYGPGQFIDPYDIAIHPDGRIAVVDHVDDRVQVFHPNGTLALAFGTLGRGPGQLVAPSHIAIGPVMLPPSPPPPPADSAAPPPPPPPSPTSAGGDAHAEQAGPTMFVVQDGALNMFHPNGTFAFERDVWIPGNIGIGPNGRIVSLSYGDCHVTTYHPNGTADFCFGKLGRGPGQFDNAHSLAVGPDGRIAVTDSGNARVQVFHPNGTLVFAFGTRDDGQLPDPDGVDIGPDGRVYVVNAGRQPYNITVLHPNGTLDFSSALSERVRSNVVAVGPDGRIAMRYSHDVRIFHPNGTLDHVIGSRGYGPGQFIDPYDIAIHPDGRIAVVDHVDDRVQVFHPNGTLALAFGTLGRGPGQLVAPSHIAIGPVMLPPSPPPPPADSAAPPPPPPPSPTSAGGDAHAEQAGPTMFVVQDGALNMFHPNGTFAFERDVWIPGNIGIGPNGRIVSLSYGDCHVTTYHPNGTADFCFGKLGRGPGQFDNAHSLAVGPDGRIAVTDSGNARVQVFHPNGTLVFAFGTRDDGQLPDPDGVDIGPDGRVYVVNAGRQPYNITVLHPNGTLDFSSALSERVRSNVVAVGPDGRIAMRYSHDVRIFHPNGTLDHVIGSRGYGPGQFIDPYDIAIHPDGRIAVVDHVDDRVQVFHPNGTLALAFGTLGRGPGQLVAPSHIAIGPVMLPPSPPPPPADDTVPPPLPPTPAGPPNGTAPPTPPPSTAPPAHSEPRQDVIVVSYYNGSILAYHPANGTLAFAFGRSAAAADGDSGQFDEPSEVAVGPDGTVVVVDDDHRVRAYHPNGTLAFDVGSYDGSYRFHANADGVGIGPDGSIAVADFRHGGRVFHPNGTLAFTFELEWGGNVTDRHTIAADVGPDGRIFVGGAVGIAGDPDPSRRIQAFHPNGTLDFAFGSHGTGPGQFYWGPYDVAVGPDGRIFATEHCDVIGCGGPANRVQVFHPNGTLASVLGAHGDGLGLVSFPNRVAVGPDGGVYVVDDARVLAFHPNGTIAFIIWSPANDTWPNVPSDVAVGPVPPPPPPLPPPPPAPVTVVIEPGTAPGPLNFTGAGDAADLAIDVAGLAAPGGPPLDGSASSTVTFPPAETSIAASFATVTFPPGVAATHVPADGRLALRVAADVPDDARVQGALAYEGSGRVTLQRIVEVGAASGRVEFDMPVRILLEGQAGGRAFYIEGGVGSGTITPIDQACAADDTGRVHRHLGGAGECQTDSAAGDKIIHTYHLTRFGTAQPERAVPPPTVDTCSVGIGESDPRVSARPGGYSDAFRQEVVNSGSAQFAHVSLTATQWSNGLPASATEVRAGGAGGAYVPLADGTAVAGGLGGGEVASVWFRVNLTPHVGVQAGELVQAVTYQAACGAP